MGLTPELFPCSVWSPPPLCVVSYLLQTRLPTPHPATTTEGRNSVNHLPRTVPKQRGKTLWRGVVSAQKNSRPG